MQFFYLLLICSIFCFVDAESKELLDAIKKSMTNNHQLKSAGFLLKATEKGAYQAYSTMLPVASFTINIDSNTRNIQNTTTLNINQPVFNFGYSYFSLKKAMNVNMLQKSSFNLTKQRIIMNAVASYMQLLKAREITKLCTKTVSVMEKHLQAAEKRFQLGEITKADLAQAKSKLSSANAELVKASGDENILIANYTHVIGEPPDIEKLNYPSQMPKFPSNLQDALDEAKKNNNALKSAYYNREISDYSKKETYTRILPSVSLNASWVHSNFNINSSQLQNSGGINIVVPIFQGGAEYANILSAKYKFYSSVQDYYEAIKSLEESVISAWLNCESAKSLIKASLDSVNAYETAVESVKKEVALNTKSILDLLDVEIYLLSANISLVDAKSSYIISNYNLILNVGDINTLFT